MNLAKRQAAPLPWETRTLALIGLSDLGLTMYLLHTGTFTEGNPILHYYLAAGISVFVAAKLLLTLGPLTVLELLRPQSPRFVRSALRAGIGLYLCSYAIGVCQLNVAPLMHLSR